MLVRSILAAALAAALPQAAAAAILRPITTLSSAVVRLSDLFDDAGPEAHLALGPAPAPGQTITVEAPQLAYIARHFGVDWRPVSEGDRAVLTRAGVPLPRDAVMTALRAPLAQAGAPGSDIELPGFDPPLVPPEAHAQAVVEGISFDGGSGRFSASLVVTGADMAPLRLTVSGEAVAMQDVLVAAHRLEPGTPLTQADLRPARLRSDGLPGAVVREAAQAAGLAPRSAIAAGAPVPRADLAPPELVARGAMVSISLSDGALALSSLGQALEPGAAGARIRVLNPVSRAVLLAQVTGPDAVRLDPGSMPLRPGTDAPHAAGAP